MSPRTRLPPVAKREAFRPGTASPGAPSPGGFQLPSRVYLSSAMVDGGELVRFTYAESFEDAELSKRTAALVRGAIENVKVTLADRGHTIVLRGTVPRKQFGNMMIGEFMNWGTLGSITFSDLLMGAAVRGR